MVTGESHVNPLVAAAVANSAAQPRRTASGRAVRANTTRPQNYYARTLGNGISAADRDNDAADGSNTDAAGFFPALQFFTDAITATPKEVIKHFTLLKEVESKIIGPQEELGAFIDALMQQPVPLRKQTASAANGAAMEQGLLALTANNSTSGSANVSMINGMAGQHSAQPSLAGSTVGEDAIETEADRIRRHQYHGLRALTHSLLGNMDEKNVVLSEANRVLALQHKRLDSVWPHLEEEIGEDARLGSMTHWAYSDNRQKIKATTNTQSRRDGIAATNALANVAAAIHDNEVAQARRDAGREARGEKSNKGKRATEHAGDSDFDDKPRKAPKVGKGKAAASAATGLGISTNGEPGPKRRKNAADKQMAPPPMERTISTTGRGGKVKDTPRSTPVIDPPAAKKAPKAKPGLAKGKKIGGSTHNSPMLASSPLASSFNPATMEVPPGAKTQTARLRQNSSTTNLRLQNVVQEEEAITSRPPSSAGKANGAGEKANGRRKAQEAAEEQEDRSIEQTTKSQLNAASEQLRREETGENRGEKRQPASRSGSDRDISRKASGRQSKVGTPRTDSFPDGSGMVRSRSTRRSKPASGESQDSDSDEPQTRMPGGSRHKRQQSNSHLVKQLAPFNRSPDLDRHKSGDENDSDSDQEAEENQPDEQGKDEAAAEEGRCASTRRPLSRRNTLNTSPAPNSRDSTPPPSPPTSVRGNGRSTAASLAAKREAEAEAARRELVEAETVAANVEVEEEEEDSEHDPDDPNEPKYCYCNRGSYGEMVACDNDDCPREWFHLGCTELREAPSEEEKWYCKECRPLFGQKVGRKGKAGRGRGG